MANLKDLIVQSRANIRANEEQVHQDNIKSIDDRAQKSKDVLAPVAENVKKNVMSQVKDSNVRDRLDASIGKKTLENIVVGALEKQGIKKADLQGDILQKAVEQAKATAFQKVNFSNVKPGEYDSLLNEYKRSVLNFAQGVDYKNDAVTQLDADLRLGDMEKAQLVQKKKMSDNGVFYNVADAFSDSVQALPGLKKSIMQGGNWVGKGDDEISFGTDKQYEGGRLTAIGDFLWARGGALDIVSVAASGISFGVSLGARAGMKGASMALRSAKALKYSDDAIDGLKAIEAGGDYAKILSGLSASAKGEVKKAMERTTLDLAIGGAMVVPKALVFDPAQKTMSALQIGTATLPALADTGGSKALQDIASTVFMPGTAAMKYFANDDIFLDRAQDNSMFGKFVDRALKNEFKGIDPTVLMPEQKRKMEEQIRYMYKNTPLHEIYLDEGASELATFGFGMMETVANIGSFIGATKVATYGATKAQDAGIAFTLQSKINSSIAEIDAIKEQILEAKDDAEVARLSGELKAKIATSPHLTSKSFVAGESAVRRFEELYSFMIKDVEEAKNINGRISDVVGDLQVKIDEQMEVFNNPTRSAEYTQSSLIDKTGLEIKIKEAAYQKIGELSTELYRIPEMVISQTKRIGELHAIELGVMADHFKKRANEASMTSKLQKVKMMLFGAGSPDTIQTSDYMPIGTSVRDLLFGDSPERWNAIMPSKEGQVFGVANDHNILYGAMENYLSYHAGVSAYKTAGTSIKVRNTGFKDSIEVAIKNNLLSAGVNDATANRLVQVVSDTAIDSAIKSAIAIGKIDKGFGNVFAEALNDSFGVEIKALIDAKKDKEEISNDFVELARRGGLLRDEIRTKIEDTEKILKDEYQANIIEIKNFESDDIVISQKTAESKLFKEQAKKSFQAMPKEKKDVVLKKAMSIEPLADVGMKHFKGAIQKLIKAMKKMENTLSQRLYSMDHMEFMHNNFAKYGVEKDLIVEKQKEIQVTARFEGEKDEDVKQMKQSMFDLFSKNRVIDDSSLIGRDVIAPSQKEMEGITLSQRSDEKLVNLDNKIFDELELSMKHVFVGENEVFIKPSLSAIAMLEKSLKARTNLPLRSEEMSANLQSTEAQDVAVKQVLFAASEKLKEKHGFLMKLAEYKSIINSESFKNTDGSIDKKRVAEHINQIDAATPSGGTTFRDAFDFMEGKTKGSTKKKSLKSASASARESVRYWEKKVETLEKESGVLDLKIESMISEWKDGMISPSVISDIAGLDIPHSQKTDAFLSFIENNYAIPKEEVLSTILKDRNMNAFWNSTASKQYKEDGSRGVNLRKTTLETFLQNNKDSGHEIEVRESIEGIDSDTDLSQMLRNSDAEEFSGTVLRYEQLPLAHKLLYENLLGVAGKAKTGHFSNMLLRGFFLQNTKAKTESSDFRKLRSSTGTAKLTPKALRIAAEAIQASVDKSYLLGADDTVLRFLSKDILKIESEMAKAGNVLILSANEKGTKLVTVKTGKPLTMEEYRKIQDQYIGKLVRKTDKESLKSFNKRIKLFNSDDIAIQKAQHREYIAGKPQREEGKINVGIIPDSVLSLIPGKSPSEIDGMGLMTGDFHDFVVRETDNMTNGAIKQSYSDSSATFGLKGLWKRMQPYHSAVDEKIYSGFKTKLDKLPEPDKKMLEDYDASYFVKYYIEKIGAENIDMIVPMSVYKNIQGEIPKVGSVMKINLENLRVKKLSDKDVETSTFHESLAQIAIQDTINDIPMQSASVYRDVIKDAQIKEYKKLEKAATEIQLNPSAFEKILGKLGLSIEGSALQGRAAYEKMLGGVRTDSVMNMVKDIFSKYIKENVLNYKVKDGSMAYIDGSYNTKKVEQYIGSSGLDKKGYTKFNYVILDKEIYGSKIKEFNGVPRLVVSRFPATKQGSMTAPYVIWAQDVGMDGLGKSAVLNPYDVFILKEGDFDGDKLMMYYDDVIAGESGIKYFDDVEKARFYKDGKLKSEKEIIVEFESQNTNDISKNDAITADKVFTDELKGGNGNRIDGEDYAYSLVQVFSNFTNEGEKRFDAQLRKVKKAKELLDKRIADAEKLGKTYQMAPFERLVYEMDLEKFNKILFGKTGNDAEAHKNVIEREYPSEVIAWKEKDKVSLLPGMENEKALSKMQEFMDYYKARHDEKKIIKKKYNPLITAKQSEIANAEAELASIRSEAWSDDKWQRTKEKQRAISKLYKEKEEIETNQMKESMRNKDDAYAEADRLGRDLKKISQDAYETFSKMLITYPWSSGESGVTSSGTFHQHVNLLTEKIDYRIASDFYQKFNKEYSEETMKEISGLRTEDVVKEAEKRKSQGDERTIDSIALDIVEEGAKEGLVVPKDTMISMFKKAGGNEHIISKYLDKDEYSRDEVDSIIDDIVFMKSIIANGSAGALKIFNDKMRTEDGQKSIIGRWMKDEMESFILSSDGDINVSGAQLQKIKEESEKNKKAIQSKKKRNVEIANELSSVRMLGKALSKMRAGWSKDQPIESMKDGVKEVIAEELIIHAEEKSRVATLDVYNPEVLKKFVESKERDLYRKLYSDEYNSIDDMFNSLSGIHKKSTMVFGLVRPLIEYAQGQAIRAEDYFRAKKADISIKDIAKRNGIKEESVLLPEPNKTLAHIYSDLDGKIGSEVPDSIKKRSEGKRGLLNKMLGGINRALGTVIQKEFDLYKNVGISMDKLFDEHYKSVFKTIIAGKDNPILIKNPSLLSPAERIKRDRLVQQYSEQAARIAKKHFYNYAENPALIEKMEVVAPFSQFAFSTFRNLRDYKNSLGGITSAFMTLTDYFGQEDFYYDPEEERYIDKNKKLLQLGTSAYLFDLNRYGPASVSGLVSPNISPMIGAMGGVKNDMNTMRYENGDISTIEYIGNATIGSMAVNALRGLGGDDLSSKDATAIVSYMAFGQAFKDKSIDFARKKYAEGDYEYLDRLDKDTKKELIDSLNKKRKADGKEALSDDFFKAKLYEKELGLMQFEAGTIQNGMKLFYEMQQLTPGIPVTAEQKRIANASSEFMEIILSDQLEFKGDPNKFLEKVVQFAESEKYPEYKKVLPKVAEMYDHFYKYRKNYEYYWRKEGREVTILPVKDGYNLNGTLLSVALKYKTNTEYETIEKKMEALAKGEDTILIGDDGAELTQFWMDHTNRKGLLVDDYNKKVKTLDATMKQRSLLWTVSMGTSDINIKKRIAEKIEENSANAKSAYIDLISNHTTALDTYFIDNPIDGSVEEKRKKFEEQIEKVHNEVSKGVKVWEKKTYNNSKKEYDAIKGTNGAAFQGNFQTDLSKQIEYATMKMNSLK